jgi:hypothetical protein
VGSSGVGGALPLGRPPVPPLLGVGVPWSPGDRAGAWREVQGASGLAAGRARPASLAGRDVSGQAPPARPAGERGRGER